MTQCIDTVGNGFERVNVQALVSLVQNRELWFEHGHLQYLVFLFLATRKPIVEISLFIFFFHSKHLFESLPILFFILKS